MTHRYVVPFDAEAEEGWWDGHGFPVLDRIPANREASELLAERFVVVAGEPWIGKTYVSEQLAGLVRHERFSGRLSLEEGDRTVTPGWWSEWQSSQEQAWWIIDALDEALHAPNPSVSDVLGPVALLRPQQRARLHLLLFTRDDDSLSAVRKWLSTNQLKVEVFRLLPMSSAEAARVIGDPVALSRALQHLMDPALRQLARYKPVLDVLANSPAKVTRVAVLREALEALLMEYSDRRVERTAKWNTNELFEAASRVAAIMLLCDLQTVRLQSGSGQLRVRDAFPDRPEMRAAAERLRHTAVFQRTAAGYRFRQRFVMELFAAFGLRDVDPEGFRLVSRGSATEYPARLSALEAVLREISPQVLSDALPDLTVVQRRRTLAWATAQIDALLSAVGDAPWARLANDDTLKELKVRGIERVVKTRVSDRKLSDGKRELLFRIAHVCELSTLVSAAIAIAMDAEDAPSVRTSAIYFATRFGEKDAARKLKTIGTSRDGSAPAQGRARVIEMLVRYELMDPLDAAGIAPPPQKHLYDARAAALGAIEERLTVEDARRIMDDWNGTRLLSTKLDDAIRDRLRRRAIELMLTENSWLAEDARRLAQLVREGLLHEGGDELRERLQKDPALRESLYRELFSGDGAWIVSSALVPDDLNWMVDLASRQPEHRVLDDLYRLMRSAGEDDPRARAARRWFEEHHPEEAARRDEAWAKAEVERGKWEEQRQRPAKPEPIPIADAVRDVPSRARTPTEELRLLGWVVFSKQPFRPHDVAGSFHDLPPDTQVSIVEKVRKLLAEADPQPVPPPAETSYSANLMYEAEAFRAALMFDGRREWLDAAIVAKWLPAVLFASHDESPAIVAETHKSHPIVTRDCALAAVRRELSSRDYAETARRLPVEVWSDEFSERIGEFVQQGGEMRTVAKGALLRVLAVRAPGIGARVARQLLADDGVERESRVGAADVLLAVDPEDIAWSQVVGLIRDSRDVAQMKGLLRELGAEPYTDEKRLPSALLGALAERLVQFYPAARDLDRLGPRWVGPDDEARDARDRILGELINRSVTSVDEAEMVARISAVEPAFASWAATVRAAAALESVLEQIAPTSTVPAVADVVRVFEDRTYRPVRTEVDLWRVVSEILRTAVQSTVGDDVELLYDSPFGRKSERNTHEHRANEGKLQAYVRRRLEDLFPRYCDSISFKPLYVREPQEKYRHRADLLVLAALESGRTAAVAIEIKWSHDRRCGKSLTDQLVKKYLVAEGRSYGVYLVGWSGKPGRRRWEELKRLHETQSKRASSRHAGMRVAAEHLTCPWKEEEATAGPAQLRRRGTRRHKAGARSRS